MEKRSLPYGPAPNVSVLWSQDSLGDLQSGQARTLSSVGFSLVAVEFISSQPLATLYRIDQPEPCDASRARSVRPIVATSSGRLFLNGLLAGMARLRFTG